MRDTAHRRSLISRMLLIVMLLSLMIPTFSQQTPVVAAQPATFDLALNQAPTIANAQVNWCFAGGFQNWDNAATPANDEGLNGDLVAGDGIYSLDVEIATAGRSEWKAVVCGSWETSVPAGPNAWMNTTQANQTVKLTLDTNNYSSNAGNHGVPSNNIIHAYDSDFASWTAVGSFQNPVWTNNDPATAMTSLGNGWYYLAYTVPNAGTYEGKVVHTGDWTTQYTGVGRAADQGNISFTTTQAGQMVVFLLDTNTSRLTIRPQTAGNAGPWCAPGTYQTPQWQETGSPLVDNGTQGDLVSGDGVFSLDVVIPAAGTYEWKVNACNWATAFPAANAWIYTDQPNQTVKLLFDSNNHAADNGWDLLPTQNVVNAIDASNDFTVVGAFQGWSNNNPATKMIQIAPNQFVLHYTIAAPGDYAAKFTRTGSWVEQYNAQGRVFDANDPAPIGFTTTNLNETVVFYLDNRTGRVAITPQRDGQVPDSVIGDGLINRDAIEHHSRESLYRVPFGAAPLNQAVNLRLRTAAHDINQARIRLYYTANNGQSIQRMTKVASDEMYDYWEYTMPAQTALGVVYYRFIIEDGATTLFYEDDNRFDGGLGEVVNASADRSWNIYIYDPAFTTPEWAQNATIYQIFVERFRNGDTSNDPTGVATDTTYPGRGWFYPTERGHRFPVTPWNSIVPDPEPFTDQNNPWWSTYSSTMYGGDLNGVQDKLDYLQDLGVTTLYLNPIFDSPSNHKYDGRNYRTVDPAFGGQQAFDDLVADAHGRGMTVVLDGVPNHVSSDSPFFDRFGRHAEVGACESTSSPYRTWFFFEPAAEPGTGVCAGDTNYRGWFGVATLPQINTNHPEVMAYWFGTAGGNPNLPTNTASYWVDGTNKADGWRIDVVPDVIGVNPTFFETWRDVMKAANPDAVLYSETWSEGDVRDRVLGDEFDSTMNYRYRRAVLGFLRDTRWVDNDGGQEIDPLLPSQFVNSFETIREDYPEPAYNAAMNLIDSHDTNRAVHVLNELGFTGTGYDRQPVDNFVDARHRLSLVAALQMTLPGAPTIYYGDEVGLTGYGFDVPRDDPYNRQPYPWTDQAGYNSLPEWRKADTNLLATYQRLGQLRRDYSYLRTGSFDVMTANDANKVLAYGRKDENGAAIVVFNRDSQAHSIELNLAGYVPTGTVLTRTMPLTQTGLLPATDVTTYTFSVAPQSVGIWLTPDSVDMSAPAAPTNLQVTNQLSQSIELGWNSVATAESYNIYRSIVSGGGYELVGNTTSTSFSSADLTPGQRYYYIVKAVRNGLESTASNEVSGLPAYVINWSNLQFPATINHTISITNPTTNIYGQVYIAGVTSEVGATPSVLAEVGYGPDGSQPNTASWTWFDANFNVQNGNNDEYVGNLLPSSVGTFDVAYRYSTDGGTSWIYADLDGSDNGYSPAQAASLVVAASSDTTAPTAPLNLREVRRSASQIVIGWDVSSANDTYRYDVYRDGNAIASVLHPTTIFTDTEVTAGITYTYQLKALDGSFNQSEFSNSVSIRAEQRVIDVTFRVKVPVETPTNESVYIAGNDGTVFNGAWTANGQIMQRVLTDTWEFNKQILEGTALEYKYTRGAWERVESWGTIEAFTNRRVTIEYGNNGHFIVDDTDTNWGTGDDNRKAVQAWRDPLVSSSSIANNAVEVAPTVQPAITWSQVVTTTTPISQVLVLTNAQNQSVAGTVVATSPTTFSFIPAAPLPNGTYTLTAFNVRRVIGDPSPMQQRYVVRFTVGRDILKIFLPIVGRSN
ncbi:MAG TPA: hypothetical protein DEF47_22825 [Herpetosiphon sp.]|uniref:Alpha amylase catalytic region n=1 Tax=Herpetosiphon aurantiacus (strain ATCC 23779 / DSM 785 / 114-95) TaxID=316274 RepID=A9AY85_HERA2|nr:alpha amylase N-terminal ig-like domain-containing protein [Herpetosiphon sp.]ABX06967.1 alpha amylase catalytic region [Herpetosiphon aurantiacus DSM 785]HBW52725.1 hypothetical protein [Herpetosiphon sp.]